MSHLQSQHTYSHTLSFYRKRPFRPFLRRPAHPVMLGRSGRQWEGHSLTLFGSARTTRGSPTSESQTNLRIHNHTSSVNFVCNITCRWWKNTLNFTTSLYNSDLLISMSVHGGWLVATLLERLAELFMSICFTVICLSDYLSVCLSVCLYAAWFSLLARQRVWLPPPARR